MNRKLILKSLTAAIAMACAGSASAVAVGSFNEASSTQVTLRIGGSTAHDKGLLNVLALTATGAQFCVPGTLDVYTNGSSVPGNLTIMMCSSGADSGVGTGKVIALLRNGNYGSGSGVSHLVKGTTTATDSTNAAVLSQYLDPTNPAVATSGSTVAAANGLSAYTVHTGVPTSAVITALADMGITDEEPKLFKDAFLPAITGTETAALTVKGISAVIFGVPVTDVLYKRLQALQFATDTSCHPSNFGTSGANLTEACVPSLSRDTLTAIYTGGIGGLGSIRSANNSTETAASVAPYGQIGTNSLFIERRVATSGTQLASQAYFGSQGCLDGSPSHLTSTTARVTMHGGSSGVRNAMVSRNTNGQAAVGVLSTELATTATTGYHFIKVDGYTPTVLNAVKGNYDFWYESAVNYRKVAIGGAAALAGNQKAVADKIATALGNTASVKLLNASFKLDNTQGTDGTSPGRGGLLVNAVGNTGSQAVTPYIATDTATATNDVHARPVAKSTRGLGGTPNACLNPSHLGTTQAGN